MSSPDIIPGRGASETDIIKDEIRRQTTDQIKAEFNSQNANARELRNKIDSALMNGANQINLEGDVTNPTSEKRKALDVRKQVIKVLLSADDPVKIPSSSKDLRIVDFSRTVIQKIRNEITPAEINEYNSPYLYDFLHDVISGKYTKFDDLVGAADKIKILAAISPELHKKVMRSFVEIGVAQGVPEKDAKEKLHLREESSSSREISSYDTNSILYNKLGEKDRRFLLCLNSAEAFQEYCQEQRQAIMLDDEYRSAPAAKQSEILARKLSAAIKERTTSIVYKIYEHVLHERKNEAIEHLETEGGLYNSVSVLFSGFRQKVETLMADVEGKQFEFDFAIPKREEENIYDPVKKQFERAYRVLPAYERVHDPKEFLEFIMRETDSERTRIRYGFNLEYIARTGAYKPEDGLMKTIAGYATNLRSDQIDEIFIERTGEVVQAAISLFDQRNEKFFAFSNWRSDPGHMDEYFSNIDKMKEHVEHYIRHQFKDRYDDWMIERAIFNAKLVIYGMYFKPMLWYSYADPKLSGAGGPSYRGEGEQGLAIFDPGHLGKRFHGSEPGKHIGVELVTKGVDFLPMNQIIDKYDYKVWEKYYAAWKESFEKGKASFYGLAGKDCFNLQLFIDMGNITASGGVDTLSGWRYFSAYKDWIRDSLDTSENIRFAENGQTLVEMWKRLENIGLDVLENYAGKFIIDKIPGKADFEAFIGNKNQLKSMEKLYEFIYDRYLGAEEGVGKDFLRQAGINGKEQFMARISDLMENSKFSKQERVGELKGWIYKAFSIIIYERMPLKYVLLEKQRYTQNGVTLLSELRDFAQQSNWSMEGKDNQFEQAIDDLILAQTELRLIVSDDMQRLVDIPGGNLFGDLNRLRSNVNGGRGYVLNKDTIKSILTKSLGDQARVDRALAIYSKLGNLVVEKPSVAAWEKDQANSGDIRKLYTNRLSWFYGMYKDNKFGFSPTSGELALKYISLSASGPDTIKRAANFCANTAEIIGQTWGGLLNDLREARGKRDIKDIYPKLLKMYLANEGELGSGEGPNKVAFRFLQKIIYFYRKNSVPIPGTGTIVDVIDWATKHSSSFAEEDAGGPGRLSDWEMTVDDIHKAINQLEGDLGRSIIPEEPIEPLMSQTRVSEKHKVLGTIAEKLNGGKPIYIRDYANEISGRALKFFHKSEASQFFSQNILPKLLIALLIISLILGYKSFKQDFVLGATK